MTVQLPSNGFMKSDVPYSDRDNGILIKKWISRAEAPIEFIHTMAKKPFRISKIQATKPVDFGVELIDEKRVVLCFTEKNLEIVMRFE